MSLPTAQYYTNGRYLKYWDYLLGTSKHVPTSMTVCTSLVNSKDHWSEADFSKCTDTNMEL